jgi:hypothetical protein
MRLLDITGAYYLNLSAEGYPTHTIRVRTANEAAVLWEYYRDFHDIGASEMTSECGRVTDAQGKLHARISYNGRIWDANQNPVDAISGNEWLASRALKVGKQ